ncbi:MAG: TetR/AcrR family transcriptional regulator [Maritalea sp.]|jgi:TetR/AcrR family transcriptional regulator
MNCRRNKKVDPKHLIFSIWATTQHYADFEEQVRLVLGRSIDDPAEFENTKAFLVNMFTSMLKV